MWVQQASNLKNTCANFKRLIGRKFDDPEVARERAFNTVETVASRDGGVGYKVWYNGEQQVFSAQQMTGMFLYRLREIAEKEAGARVPDVVISCPVWYADQERHALVDAAHIAGFNVLALLHESTACTWWWCW
jgi:molecular chaperone DnaK (HSP70)